MPIRFVSQKEWPKIIVISVTLSLTLALGFLPTSRGFSDAILRIFNGWFPSSATWDLRWIRLAFFPALALFFHLSLPLPAIPCRRASLTSLIRISLLPVLIALLFGAVRSGPSLFDQFRSNEGRLALAWYILFDPIGEEALFRGWLFTLTERLWPGRVLAMLPFPLPVWLTAIGFSVWHLQNLGNNSPGMVAFQLGYAFFAGLWLGYLRWKSGRLSVTILAHCLINLASNLV